MPDDSFKSALAAVDILFILVNPRGECSMGTIVALESRGGVVIAGDSQTTTGRTVTSQNAQRIFDFDAVGAGVVGATGDIQEFRRHFEDELRELRINREENLEIDKVARIAARHAETAKVDAVVAARDADETARLREVGSDGRVLENSTAALGSGAEVAYGRLETVDLAVSLTDATSTASDIVKTVVARDSESGGDTDVWSLSNATDTEDDYC